MRKRRDGREEKAVNFETRGNEVDIGETRLPITIEGSSPPTNIHNPRGVTVAVFLDGRMEGDRWRASGAMKQGSSPSQLSSTGQNATAEAVTSRLYSLSARGFAHMDLECVSLCCIWKDRAVNSNVVLAFDSGSGIVLGIDPSHIIINPDPILDFVFGFVLDFGPSPGCSLYHFDADTAHNSNLYKSKTYTSIKIKYRLYYSEEL
ncbi:hypothetical protein EVAR_40391_1 [Eumeta japonica]|uniref:Uncharacterized protein n=1 Tax=Eumeta variegata TaxID=151549 RepID=A0A4C1WCV8_EUMVA|nr:hypothetical protein EVAR_40391_1 [Eumeta japonica]